MLVLSVTLFNPPAAFLPFCIKAREIGVRAVRPMERGEVAADREICYGSAMQGDAPAPLRRVEALAYIVERISRSGTAPSYGEIAGFVRPTVHISRARQFVDQLVREGYLERQPASRRGIAIRDVVRCRQAIEDALGMLGYKHASPLGAIIQPPSIFGQLHAIPPFEYLPDID